MIKKLHSLFKRFSFTRANFSKLHPFEIYIECVFENCHNTLFFVYSPAASDSFWRYYLQTPCVLFSYLTHIVITFQRTFTTRQSLLPKEIFIKIVSLIWFTGKKKKSKPIKSCIANSNFVGVLTSFFCILCISK